MGRSHSIALRVALVYALASTLWILLTGMWAVSLPAPLEGYAELTKGLFFVACTSALLYWTISRWVKAVADEAGNTIEARRQLERVIDTVPVGVLLLDGNGRATFLNPVACRLLDMRPAEGTSMHITELLGAKTAWNAELAVAELFANGVVDGIPLPAPYGVPARMAIARAAELDPKRPEAGWIVALADNTGTYAELRRSARLLQGYRFLSELASLIGSTRDARSLVRQICELAVAVGGFKAAAGAVAAEDGTLVEAGTVGISGAALDVAQRMRSATREAVAAMAPRFAASDVIIENDMSADSGSPWATAAGESGFGSCALLGIVERGRLTASIALFAEGRAYFGEDEKRLMLALRDALATGLDRISLEQFRLNAEEALARSAEEYRQLFDANPQPMYVCDRVDLSFLAVNEAMVRKYGYAHDQFLAMKITEIRPGADVARLIDHLAHKNPEGVVDAGFWTHHDAGGREFPVHIFTHCMQWDGHDAELVLVEEVAQIS